jgi:hypothetical protein
LFAIFEIVGRKSDRQRVHWNPKAEGCQREFPFCPSAYRFRARLKISGAQKTMAATKWRPLEPTSRYRSL